MNLKEIIYLFSDQNIGNFIDIIKSDFMIITLFFGGGILWILKKWTSWTPWKSDDVLVDKIGEKFGLNQNKEK